MSQKYKKSRRCYLIDHHSPQPPTVSLDNLDINEYENFIDTAQIDSMMVYCKDHWGVSYYDTAVKGAVKHRGLKNDWISQVSKLLKRKEIEFIAYYCIEYDEGAARSFPEWRVQKPDGSYLIRDDAYAKWSLCCYQTPYRQYCLDQLKEIVTNYQPDALFLDIFGASLCYCPSCRAKFQAAYGYSLPESEDEILEHKTDITEFLNHNAEEFLQDIHSALMPVDEEIAVTINFSCHYPEAIRRLLEYQFSEPLLKDNWFSSVYARDTASGQYPILAPGEASQVYNYDCVNQYICDLSSIAAQGCRVGMYSGSQHIDGTLDFEEAKRLGAVYGELKKLEPYLIDRTPVKCAGIVQSDISRSINLAKLTSDAILRMKHSDPHMNAILGAMMLCENNKIPYGIVPDNQITKEILAYYDLLLLPELYVIEDDLAELLTEYVKNGGKLIASSLCGMWDKNGMLLPNSSISQLIGADIINIHREYEQNTWSAYLAVNELEQFDGLLSVTTPPVSDFFTELRMHSAASDHLHFVLPCVACSPSEWINWWSPPPGKVTDMPAMISNTFGKGKIFYTAFDFFTMAASDSYRYTDNLFAQLLQRLAIMPAVSNVSEHPLMLRTAYFETSGEYLIHQISMLPKLFKGQNAPLCGGKLLFREPILSARTVYPKEQALSVNIVDGTYVVELPAFSLQQMILCTKQS